MKGSAKQLGKNFGNDFGNDFEKHLDQLEKTIVLKGYSSRTGRAYRECLREYFKYLQGDIDFNGNFLKFDEVKFKEFLLFKAGLGRAGATLNLYLFAVKFFYREVLGLSVMFSFKSVKKRRRIPCVLCKEEILKVLSVISNKKHWLMIALSYGAGLRVSEVTSLKVCDLDFFENVIYVQCGKGNKDRITVLPEKLGNHLKRFVFGKKPEELLFYSERGGKLSERTIQKVFRNAIIKAGIMRNAGFHSLRHSFATHLLEQGMDITYIKELLGHRDIRTTLIYTRVTKKGLLNVPSPF